ncbi:ARM repeat-containing protein [Backusella circina FSU 941]|nr:ARM repeat-containing protein [Backusella circina FSU 941]
MGRTRKNTSGDRRSLYKRTSISRTPDELVKRRVAINDSLRKKHREQLITAKRFRNLTRHEEYESAGEEEPLSEKNEHDEDISPYYRLSNDQVVSLSLDLRNNEDKNVRLEAAQYIGKFVLEPAQALIDYITKGDCIDTLAQMITSDDPEEKIQAAQTLSNIAAGPYELWLRSVSVAPQLIKHLGSDDANLREVVAGALGNMAAEDLGDVSDEADKVRSSIRDNGAIPGLVRMLDSNEARTIQSACFALANLARGPEDQLQDFISSGITEKLYKHLTNDIAADTATEVCWVICYLTAGSQKFRQDIMAKGFAPRLVVELVKLAREKTLVLPVLRTIGNLVGSDDEYLKLLVEQDHFLLTVVDLVKSDQRSVKKEALWVLSKITSTQDPDIIRALEKLSIIDSLTNLVGRGAFDIRKGAAYGIMNIAHHGQEHLDKLPHKQLLPAFLELIKSQDADMIKLGLEYIELLLTQSANGKVIIDGVPETMEVLASVAPAPDPELFTIANKLVDQYYGEKE